MKIAVYGSLMKGLHNHKYFLKNAEYLGQFESEPEFTLFDIGSFPGLKKDGTTSILMEVYNINKDILKLIDGLEGYNKDAINTSHYKRLIMYTPYGFVFYYVYNASTTNYKEVKEGNWKEYIKEKNKKNEKIH